MVRQRPLRVCTSRGPERGTWNVPLGRGHDRGPVSRWAGSRPSMPLATPPCPRHSLGGWRVLIPGTVVVRTGNVQPGRPMPDRASRHLAPGTGRRASRSIVRAESRVRLDAGLYRWPACPGGAGEVRMNAGAVRRETRPAIAASPVRAGKRANGHRDTVPTNRSPLVVPASVVRRTSPRNACASPPLPRRAPGCPAVGPATSGRRNASGWFDLRDDGPSGLYVQSIRSR